VINLNTISMWTVSMRHLL